ncbi:MAG: EamA family transporter [Clostridia bacterium]|nr:EamA family transporter [Clostridia bacterium]
METKLKNTYSENAASLLIVLAGVCWGIIGLFSTGLAQKGLQPVQITFVRCTVAAIVLWTLLLLFDRKKLLINPKDIWMFIGTGAVSVVCFNILYFLTMQAATLSVAAILLYTAPCFVMIMSVIFFGEKLTKAKISALLLASAGCVCTSGIISTVTGSGLNGFNAIGIITGVGSGFCYALYSIFGNVALKKYDSATVTAYTFLIASVTLLLLCKVGDVADKIVTGDILGTALMLGIISTLLPFALYTAGLKYTAPGKASVLAFVEPMVATIAGVAVFNQSLDIAGAAGIILIFLSIVILNTKIGGKDNKTGNEEMLDVRDNAGNLTGVVKARRLVHRDGDAHATSHVWLVRRNSNQSGTGVDILLQKRSHNKDSFPDCYDISSAGHIPAGQDYLESAIRELKEELGIEASAQDLHFIGMHDGFEKAEFYGEPFINHEISSVYILERDISDDGFKLQKEEVQSVRWIDFDECVDMLQNGKLKHCICMDEIEMLKNALSKKTED